jgi:putative serine protease PepD
MSEFNRGSGSQFSFDYQIAPTPAPAKKPKPGVFRPLALVTLALSAALVGALIGSSALVFSFVNLSQPAPVIVNNTDSVNWVTAAAAKSSPSVVTLSVNANNGNSGSGSGVVLTESGYILTNAHVVTLSGSSSSAVISVRTFSGEVLSAQVVGTDATYDLAVLKVESLTPLTPMVFADSNSLNVGDSVVAIGAPLGLSSSVTQGIVSALGRTIQVASSEVDEEGGLEFWTGNSSAPPISLQVIQTDAAINPGNSGGALVNPAGELIGINVAIATAGGGLSGSIGVGFAIPSNTAFRIAQEIIDTGRASHGLLGAMVSDNLQPNSRFSTGALIAEVTAGGAAEAAGLRGGDIVVGFAGQSINTASELTAAVRAEPAGARVEVVVLRGGQRLSFDVVLGDAEDLNQ